MWLPGGRALPGGQHEKAARTRGAAPVQHRSGPASCGSVVPPRGAGAHPERASAAQAPGGCSLWRAAPAAVTAAPSAGRGSRERAAVGTTQQQQRRQRRQQQQQAQEDPRRPRRRQDAAGHGGDLRGAQGDGAHGAHRPDVYVRARGRGAAGGWRLTRGSLIESDRFVAAVAGSNTLLTQYSKESDGTYKYDTKTVPLLSELAKLFLSVRAPLPPPHLAQRACGGAADSGLRRWGCVVSVRAHAWSARPPQTIMLTRSYMEGNAQITLSFATAIKFPVPAFIYFICNNVNFIILSEISPASYQVLNNLKVRGAAGGPQRGSCLRRQLADGCGGVR
eukprot:scaffold2380_cov380-Prasinococcus_capsulatus_cf.AAC.4